MGGTGATVFGENGMVFLLPENVNASIVQRGVAPRAFVGFLLVVAGLYALSARRTCAQAVRPPPRFERLDGLSHNTVLSILQDRRGFLWIGTADGLNRYDGYEVEIYRHDPRDSTSLSDNTIRPLAEGPDGTLWIGTPNGLNRYDPASGRFDLVPITRDRRRRPSNIHSLTLDEAGRVWFTVQDVGGLYCYDPAADSVRRYRPGMRSARGLAPGSLNRPFTDHDGRVWVITRTDTSAVLHRYEAGRDRFRPFRLSPRWAETKIAVGVGPSATWWTDGHTVGRFASESHRFREVLSLPEGPASPSLLPAREGTLLAARDSTLWIGTDAGLYRADPKTETVSLHAIDTTGTAALSNYVLALHEDRAGIVWVGTRSGLYRYDPNRKPFVHRRLSERSGGRTVMAIAEDEDGRRWIGTLGDGLLRLDRRTGAVRSVRAPPNFPGGNRIWAIHVGGGAALDGHRGRTAVVQPGIRTLSKTFASGDVPNRCARRLHPCAGSGRFLLGRRRRGCVPVRPTPPSDDASPQSTQRR